MLTFLTVESLVNPGTEPIGQVFGFITEVSDLGLSFPREYLFILRRFISFLGGFSPSQRLYSHYLDPQSSPLGK